MYWNSTSPMKMSYWLLPAATFAWAFDIIVSQGVGSNWTSAPVSALKSAANCASAGS